MIVRIGMGPRAAGLTVRSFREHWASVHAALGAGIPGLRRYVQNRPLDARHLLGPPPGIDYCSEVVFDSIEAMEEAFGSDHYQDRVQADERQLIDLMRVSRVTGDCWIQTDGEPDAEAVKLLTFLRAHPSVQREQFLRAVVDAYPRELAGLLPLRHVQVIKADSETVRHPQCCDAVDMLWFRSLQSATEFLASDCAAAAAASLEGSVFGVVRLLATPVTIFPNAAEVGSQS